MLAYICIAAESEASRQSQAACTCTKNAHLAVSYLSPAMHEGTCVHVYMRIHVCGFLCVQVLTASSFRCLGQPVSPVLQR